MSTLRRLCGPFALIAQAISRQRKVRVVPTSGVPRTDGETIWVPSFTGNLSPHQTRLLNGMLDHETAHVLEERVSKERKEETPIAWMQKAAKESPLLKFLGNAFEDVRIERRLGAEYPGAKDNLHYLRDYLYAQAQARLVISLREEVVIGAAWLAQGRDLPWAAPSELGTELIALISEEIAAVAAADAFPEIRRAAESAYRKLAARAGAPDDPEESEEERKKRKAAFRGFCEDESEDPKEEFEREMAEALESPFAVPDADLAEKDIWRLARPSRGETYEQALESLSGTVGVLKARQVAKLQNVARRTVFRNQEDGNLDFEALARVELGARDVHLNVRRGRGVDVAAEVLLDLSGSVGHGPGSCAYWIKRAAMALSESWETLRGVEYEVMGFHNLTGERWGLGGRERGADVYTRPPFEYLMFKGWGERLVNTRERWSEIYGHLDNADHEAVWTAGVRLAARPEPRKILVVVSDGEPACAGLDSGWLGDQLRRVVRLITGSGIEVWGIGAGTSAPARFYNDSTGARHVLIGALDGMAQELLSLMSRRVLDV